MGDAVIVGLPDEDGADTEVPASARELLFTEAHYRVEVKLSGEYRWRQGLPIRLDYWEAIMWATLLLEQIPGAEDARVVPVEPHEGAAAVA
ncbi:hypothetical protein ACFC14_13660 [Microbacterium sp. NPDC055988]|uniref:hypothetical protein n=1 Tax=Microbacterium sp. NPDC055988 TaxID=3345671 RepID=UPI0035DFA29A